MVFYQHDSLKSELNQRGWRLTPQRETILQMFQHLPQGKHLNAEEIYNLLLHQQEKISLSTVYRTLHLLTKVGILRELELAEGHKHYEINSPNHHKHHHLVCLQCHKTFEFNDDSITKISQKQAEKEGVEMLDCQLTVHAVCIEALRKGWPALVPTSWSCPRTHLEKMSNSNSNHQKAKLEEEEELPNVQ
ncbi:MAG: transcriptional repressor [Okeania sp. SIO2C9]|uniref:Fur family transcriptional regulator n=1 Tax=Okeania sp. SIO2C9 TaxID=2607791 RepID=UPI0013C13A4B|nr:transcriptional repressor [Okeania sp. SIO2C9]NEQ74577.1 transcriptional repressor [Okeania sp. SIO2C9]